MILSISLREHSPLKISKVGVIPLALRLSFIISPNSFRPLSDIKIAGWLLGTTEVPSLWTLVGATVLMIGMGLVIKGEEVLEEAGGVENE